MEALVTKDHAATLGGHDSSVKLQLKWISASPTLPILYPALPFSILVPGFLIHDVAFPHTGKSSCNWAHTLTMNADGWPLVCARNRTKHFIFYLFKSASNPWWQAFSWSLFYRWGRECSQRSGYGPKSRSCERQSGDVPPGRKSSLNYGCAWVLKESISGSPLTADISLLMTRNPDQKAVDALTKKTPVLSWGSIVFHVPTNITWSWDCFFFSMKAKSLLTVLSMASHWVHM